MLYKAKGKLPEENQQESKSADISTQEPSSHAPTTHDGDWQTILFPKKTKAAPSKKKK